MHHVEKYFRNVDVEGKTQGKRLRKAALLAPVTAFMLAQSFGSIAASDFDSEKYITGDWGGVRADWAEKGVNIRLGHFSQTAYNIQGGEDRELAYADQYFVGGYFDLDTLFGWSGAEFKVEITNRNGDLINNEANMPFLLQSQQIYGRGNVTRLTQFSLTQRLLDDQLSIKVGRIYPSADFFAMSCAFQHLTFCSGGSSNYISSSWYGDPLSALGAQVTYNISDNWIIKAGAYDANPETLSLNQGLKLGTSGDTSGTTAVAEIEYKKDFGNGLDGDYRFGIVRSSLDKTKLVNEAGFPAGTTDDAVAIQDTDNAFYVNLEQQITRNEVGGGLRLFASMIRSDNDISGVGEVLAFGGFINGPFKHRPQDRVGLAIGRNSVSSELSRAQRFYNDSFGDDSLTVREHEYPIELNYNYVINPAIAVMPSIQYVINPNGDSDAQNATIVGLQLSLNF